MMLVKDPKRKDIINVLDKISQKITPMDNLLIYFAGNGVCNEDSNIGYWLPSDARKDNKTTWIKNDTFVDYLKEIETKHTLLIVDACFRGKSFRPQSTFVDMNYLIERRYEKHSRKVITSGILSGVSKRNKFPRYLISTISNNSDRYLSAEQLFRRIKAEVKNKFDLNPMYGELTNVGDEGGDFIFIRK